MNTFCPDVYFANASFCSADIFSGNVSPGADKGTDTARWVSPDDGGDVIDTDTGGAATCKVDRDGCGGGGTGISGCFFTTVVYLRISCDNDFILRACLDYRITDNAQYNSIYPVLNYFYSFHLL